MILSGLSWVIKWVKVDCFDGMSLLFTLYIHIHPEITQSFNNQILYKCDTYLNTKSYITSTKRWTLFRCHFQSFSSSMARESQGRGERGRENYKLLRSLEQHFSHLRRVLKTNDKHETEFYRYSRHCSPFYARISTAPPSPFVIPLVHEMTLNIQWMSTYRLDY